MRIQKTLSEIQNDPKCQKSPSKLHLRFNHVYPHQLKLICCLTTHQPRIPSPPAIEGKLLPTHSDACMRRRISTPVPSHIRQVKVLHHTKEIPSLNFHLCIDKIPHFSLNLLPIYAIYLSKIFTPATSEICIYLSNFL